MIDLAKRHELWADRFLKFTSVLALLTRDELIIVGAITRYDRAAVPEQMATGSKEPGLAWKHVIQDAELLSQFEDVTGLTSIAAMAQRSGLVVGLSAWGGMMIYILSPLGREVREYIDIEATLRQR